MRRRSSLTAFLTVLAATVVAIVVLLLSTSRGESPTNDGSDLPPELGTTDRSRAEELAAAALGAPRQTVRLLAATPVVWSNTCLDVDRPDTMCGQALVPGYRLTIGYEINGQRPAATHEFHADQSLTNLQWQASSTGEGTIEAVAAGLITVRSTSGSTQLALVPGSDFLLPRTDLQPGRRVRFGFDPGPAAASAILVWIAAAP